MERKGERILPELRRPAEASDDERRCKARTADQGLVYKRQSPWSQPDNRCSRYRPHKWSSPVRRNNGCSVATRLQNHGSGRFAKAMPAILSECERNETSSADGFSQPTLRVGICVP